MIIVFTAVLLVIGTVFAVNAIQTDAYNHTVHRAVYSGPSLFTDNSKKEGFSVSAISRGSTWTKVFDLNNEGVNEGALYHHERYDGKGYPKGLSGKDIPLIARIICLADSFDAMNSNRVYRNKLTKEHIINEIESNKGRQFDPEIADVMLKLLRDPDNPFDF